MQLGWVLIHRRIKEKGWYKNSKYVHLWLHILLSANHEPHEFMWNKEIIIIKDGQLLTGRKELSADIGISETSIERILRTFENEHQIEQQKTTKFRIITVLNWKEYQKPNNKTDNRRTTNGQQTDNRRTQTNNVKNVKNEKNILASDKSLAKSEGKQFNELLGLFVELNPTFNFGNTTQRKALQDLVDKLGLEKTLGTIQYAISVQGQKYAPTITTPAQLKNKLAELKVYYEREKSKSPKIAVYEQSTNR